MRTEVVRAASERGSRTQRLRNPPGMPYPSVLASHHACADIIEYKRAHLNGGINGRVPGEWPQGRVQLLVLACGERLPRGPGVKGRCAMLGNAEDEPLAGRDPARASWQPRCGQERGGCGGAVRRDRDDGNIARTAARRQGSAARLGRAGNPNQQVSHRQVIRRRGARGSRMRSRRIARHSQAPVRCPTVT